MAKCQLEDERLHCQGSSNMIILCLVQRLSPRPCQQDYRVHTPCRYLSHLMTLNTKEVKEMCLFMLGCCLPSVVILSIVNLLHEGQCDTCITIDVKVDRVEGVAALRDLGRGWNGRGRSAGSKRFTRGLECWTNISTVARFEMHHSRRNDPTGETTLGQKQVSSVLTGRDTPTNVHSSNLGPTAGSRSLVDVPLSSTSGALGSTSSGPFASAGLGSLAGTSSRSGVVVDDDADARALSTGSELDLGSLDEGGLGECQRTVEAGQVSLAHCRGLDLVLARGDLLAHALESGDLARLSCEQGGSATCVSR